MGITNQKDAKKQAEMNGRDIDEWLARMAADVE